MLASQTVPFRFLFCIVRLDALRSIFDYFTAIFTYHRIAAIVVFYGQNPGRTNRFTIYNVSISVVYGFLPDVIFIVIST